MRLQFNIHEVCEVFGLTGKDALVSISQAYAAALRQFFRYDGTPEQSRGLSMPDAARGVHVVHGRKAVNIVPCSISKHALNPHSHGGLF